MVQHNMLTRRPTVFVGALAGVIAPALLVLVLAVVTLVELSFLHRLGWSAVRRTRVEWPSLLALGGVGWLVVVAFVVCGVLGIVFALALARSMPTTSAHLGAWLLALVSAALAVVAFKADKPGAQTSWHGRIHNDAYPVIPLASVGAAALLAYGLWRSPRWRIHALAALATLSVVVVALALTNITAIAQLARYFLFGSLLVWLETLAIALLRVARAREPRCTSTKRVRP
jgi:hypothetical protein